MVHNNQSAAGSLDDSYCEIIEGSPHVERERFTPSWAGAKEYVSPQQFMDFGNQVTRQLHEIAVIDKGESQKAKEQILKILTECRERLPPKEGNEPSIFDCVNPESVLNGNNHQAIDK